MASKKPAAVPRTRERLNGAERARLRLLEDVVERGVRASIEMGKALREIRDTRLYREAGETFEAYCKQRFGLTRTRLYQFMDAVAVSETVSTMVDTPTPASERAARELAPLRDDPEAMQGAWSEAVEKHGPKPSAKQVREIVHPKPEPPAPAGNDTRFELIEDAVALLRLLPDPGHIAFPAESGDVETLEEALGWLSVWLPKVQAAWKGHRAGLRSLRSA